MGDIDATMAISVADLEAAIAAKPQEEPSADDTLGEDIDLDLDLDLDIDDEEEDEERGSFSDLLDEAKASESSSTLLQWSTMC